MAAKIGGAPVEASTQDVEVIAWTWRDGSVHLELRLTSFHNEDDVLLTHLDGPHNGSRFVTACGVPWWGIGSASGIGHSQRIDCEDCREILRSATFVGRPA
jgi:hypothetical protein